MSHRFFTLFQTPSPAITQLLTQSVIGTPGHGMLYQHQEVQKKLNAMADPYYVSLAKGEQVLGTCCFCSRDTLHAGKAVPAFYARYFFFRSGLRAATKPGLRRSAEGRSPLRKEMAAVLAGQGLGDRASGPFFHYAYMEPGNHRSAVLCREFGFEEVRRFSTILFHRLKLKADGRLETIRQSDVPHMKATLAAFYKQHTMFSFDNLFRTGTYYVMRDASGNIVAGAQATPDHWKVLELPGFSGRLILHLFSALPLLNKLIRKEYMFVTLEGLYVVPGYEACLEELMEAVLARYQRHTAMFWLDSDSALYRTVKAFKLGVVSALTKEVQAAVICKSVGLSVEEQALLKSQPAYISGTDIT